MIGVSRIAGVLAGLTVAGTAFAAQVPATLDWDAVTWPPGSLGQTYAGIGTGSVTLAVGGSTGSVADVGGNPSPNLSTVYTGGLVPAEPSLALGAQFGLLATGGLVLTVDFSHPGGVTDVSLSVFDIGRQALSYRDTVRIRAWDGTTWHAPSTVAHGSSTNFDGDDTVSGGSSCSSTSANCNASFTFAQPALRRLSIEFDNSELLLLPGFQAIAIHDLHFSYFVGDVTGTVLEDRDGDSTLSDGLPLPGAKVRLWTDDGDDVPDAGDALTASTATGGDGSYAFPALAPATYWVVVDSEGLTPDGTFNGSAGPNDAWAEQTRGPPGAWCDDGSGASVERATDGPCYGGRRANVSDAATALVTAEHVARVILTAADRPGVDFAFSFAPVVNVRDGDDAPGPGRSVQGSLRQFLQNARAIGGPNAMRFVPAVPANGSGVGGSWWEVDLAADLPWIDDAGTTVDGTAWDHDAPTSVLDLHAPVDEVTTGPELVLDVDFNGPGLYVVAQARIEDLGVHETRTSTNNSIEGVGLVLSGAAASGASVGRCTFARNANDGLRITNGAANVEVRDSVIVENGATDAFGDGVGLDGSADVVIAGSTVVGNGGHGIDLRAAANARTTISGNRIRDNGRAGSSQDAGISITQGNDTTVEQNEISDNRGPGIAIEAGTRHTIRRNSMWANGDLGIDLGADGVTRNDLNDSDSGPNQRYNFPVLAQADLVGAELRITGWSRAAATIELFVAEDDPTGFGEGRTWVATLVEGSADDTDAGVGAYGPSAINGLDQGRDVTNRFRFVLPAPAAVGSGTHLVATATSTGGSTSEFSGLVAVAAGPASESDLSLSKTVDDPAPFVGGTVVFALTVTNDGPAGTTDVEVQDILPSGYTFVAADGPYDPGTGVWSVGTLNANEALTLQLTATVLAAGDYTNVSEIVDSQKFDPDSTPGNGQPAEDDYATVSTTPQPAPDVDLRLAKIVDDAAPLVGGTVVFTLTATNDGPGHASGVVVADELPAGYAYVSDDGGGSYDTAGGKWAIGDLAAGASATLSIAATVLAAGDRVNFAEVFSVDQPDPDSTPANGAQGEDDEASASTAPVASADLAILKDDGVSSYVPGGSLAYTIVVTNAGPSAVTGATVTDALPVALTNATWTCTPAAGASCAASGSGSLNESVDLAAGASVTFVIVADVAASATGDLANTASVAVPPGTVDPDPSNDTATDVDAAGVEADLSIAKSNGATTVVPGTAVAYTIVVSNAGPSDAPGTIVADVLPPTLANATWSCVASGGAACGAASGTGDLDATVDLPAGTSATFTLVADLASDATGHLINDATVVAPAGVADPQPANNGVTDDDIVAPAADLAVTVDDGATQYVPGAAVTYVVTARNDGPSDASGASLIYVVTPPPVAISWSCSGSGAVCPAASGSGPLAEIVDLPAGASVSYSVGVTTQPGGDTNLVGSATLEVPGGVADADLSNNVATDVDVAARVADLALSMAVDDPAPQVGSQVVFSLTVRNDGPSDAGGVEVTSTLESGLSHASDDGAGDYAAAAGVWSVGVLPAGESRTLAITAVVEATADARAAAEVTASDVPDPDSTPGNGSTVEDDFAEQSVNPVSGAVEADLSLTKTVDDAAPQVGGQVEFTIAVHNAGPAAATGVVVRDALPDGYAYVADDAAGGYAPTSGDWSVGDVASGATRTLRITALVHATGDRTNTAEIVGADQPDPDSTPGNADPAEDDRAEAATDPVAVADLSLEKTASDDAAAIGSPVVFRLTVRNDGPSDATGIVVTDHVPDGYAYASDDGLGSFDPATHAWAVGSLAAGSARELHVTMTVQDGSSHENRAEVTAADQPDPDSTPGNGTGLGEDDEASASTSPGTDLVLLALEADRREIRPGEAVGYLATLTNRAAAPITVLLESLLPVGFAFVDGTARVGRAGADGVLGTADDGNAPLGSADGRPVVLGPLALAALETVHVRYAARAGSGVRPGQQVNLATPVGSGGARVGADASASVYLVADPIFDLGRIVGKVFLDLDRDDSQDAGERGVPNAMVVLDDGTYALTDEHGRYHFPALEPGHRMVKLNLLHLPPGAEAATEVSRIVRLTPGLTARANFGVLLPEHSESIGGPDAYGLPVDGRTEVAPIDVLGKTEDLSLVVNGKRVELASSDVRLERRDVLDNVLRVESALESPIVFRLAVDPREGARSWSLSVFDGAGRAQRTFDGAGEPPQQLEWDGQLESGLVAPGEIYQYQLEVEYDDGSHASSARRLFGVNRETLISLELTGEAFPSGEALLSEPARRALDEAAEVLERFPHEKVLIEGHTDSVGSREANLELSRRRAEAAAEYLVASRRFPEERIVLAWYGEDRPRATNRLPEGRELNRRVEVRSEARNVDNTDVTSRFRARPEVRIDGRPVVLGERGRFATQVAADETGRIDVRMTDSQGRSVRTSVEVPGLAVLEPAGHTIVPEGGTGGGCSWARTAGTEELSCRLAARTEPGNEVSLDGRTLAVAPDGSFSSELVLAPGRNGFGLLVRNPAGFTRIANVVVEVADPADAGQRAVVVAGVPNLTVRLPPEGATLGSPVLVLEGSTDPGNEVRVGDRPLAVAPDGTFAERLELPLGRSTLAVEVRDPAGRRGRIEREVEVARNRLFLLAFADGEVGKMEASGSLEGAPEDDDLYTEGRLAFYLKGVVAGKYLLTAAFDSGRAEADELFRDLDGSATDRLLTNLDPDRHYAVYGDASTVHYDVESQGKFYLALEGEEIDLLVGNYPISLTDTELAAYRRTLYGGRFVYRSATTTRFGAPDTEIVLFAADVRQAHVRDELRATGGSLYYLSHRDVVEGSEEVTLVVRDKTTGLVLARERQREGWDYTIKYPEGRVVFNRPVSSVATDGRLVDSAALGGHPVSVEVDYETRLEAFEKTTSGVRARQHVGDRVAVGATRIDDETASGSYVLSGVDGEVRLAGNSRVVAEYAESEGSDSRAYVSDDGGLSYREVPVDTHESGEAWKVAAELDVGEWFGRPERYELRLYHKQLDPGFFSSGNALEQGTEKTGLEARVGIGERDSVRVGHSVEERTGGTLLATSEEATVTSALWKHARERWELAVEYLAEEREDGAGNELRDSALGAARIGSRLTPKLTGELEHQATLSGPDADQTTAGVSYQVLPALALQVRAADGDLGSSTQAGAVWTADGREVYLTQRTFDRPGADTSTTVLGTRAPLGESSRVYSEYQREDATGDDRALTLVGIQRQWDPAPGLAVLLSGELADIEGQVADGTRSAVAASVSWSDGEDLSALSRAEVRTESGDTDRSQVHALNRVEWRWNEDFTLSAKWRYSRTEDRDANLVEARLEERSLGVAYRPTRHDRFNSFARYTHLLDLRPEGLDPGGRVERTMDVVSIETIYELHPRLEWLGKGAVRDQSERAGLAPEIEGRTFLAIQRLEFALRSPWELGLEYRVLRDGEANDRRQGWLGEVTWEVLRHLRVGAGYNFTDFSDDEFSQNDYSVEGWFFRVQGRY